MYRFHVSRADYFPLSSIFPLSEPQLTSAINMRLLNTKTFQLAEFHNNIPTYAILSHTWEEEEVTFQDIQKFDVAKGKAGWQKISNACTYARKYNFEWIWIDTCCIDKSSSAELSEAINSMYQYYENARVCYAYLCDASSGEDPRDVGSGFRKSRWFERGWTLQELLAPRYVVLLDKNWKEIGTRWSLRDAVSAITSIPVKVFEQGNIKEYSIAQRMSWVSCRKTTRPEDMAYCLMGLFGVNITPIYGEGGPKAFMRLQQEIIKYSDDRSIFAWIAAPSQIFETRGLLARSPYEFRSSGEICESSAVGSYKSSFSFGNNGIHIRLPLHRASHLGNDIFISPLYCCTNDGRHVALYLQRANGHDQYFRCYPNQLPFINTSSPNSFQNLNKIVVKESSRSHVKGSTGSLQAMKFHIKLLDHRIIFLWEHKSLDSDTSHDSHLGLTTVRMNFKGGHDVSMILHYKTQIGQKFVVVLNVKPDPIPKIQMQIQQSPPVRLLPPAFFPLGHGLYHSMESYYVDRILFPFADSTDILTCTLQVTGDPLENIIEVGYLSNSIGKTLQSPIEGFTVYPATLLERNISPKSLSFQDLFPPDYYRKTDSDQVCYVSLPASQMYCVLAYTNLFPNRILYVALGLHESGIPWTDIVVSSDKELQTEKIWKSYSDLGTRAEYKQRLQASASTTLILGPRQMKRTINVITKTRVSMQLGSYFLKLLV
ncbi:hypothetical protein VKT23_007996 [Stygiomarasmius scandens]|uniref:Heterokaryon incompatibility domain-containing protein n=1 Tax=Marasmiellus scandens TaxID=2682957 RepID=A0ABR1JM97_9AGAR